VSFDTADDLVDVSHTCIVNRLTEA